jgi:hypothetical protein
LFDERRFGEDTMQMLPFLTQLDTRAVVKGSRDPLGVQGIWTRLGRQVVGNLTTVSSSARDFTVLLLGYYFAERVVDAGGTEGELATFLKWEQLAAYARARSNPEEGFRGTDRVRTRLADGGRVKLGLSNDAQILSNQKVYGLWGLFSVPARSSGLLENEPRLTPEARGLVERFCLPRLGAGASGSAQGIVERLRQKECAVDLRDGSRDSAVLDGVASAISDGTKALRDAYTEHLVCGGAEDRTNGVQRAFADLLVETTNHDDWRLNAEALVALINATKEDDVGRELARRLGHIRTCELLLAPTVALFEFVLGHDGQSQAYISEQVRSAWGGGAGTTIAISATEAIEAALRAGADADTGLRWLRMARALRAGAYEDAVNLVLEQNASVMRARSSGAPWAAFEQGKLRVRFQDEQIGRLPAANGLPTYWRHAYFIESLRNVAFEVRGPNG